MNESKIDSETRTWPFAVPQRCHRSFRNNDVVLVAFNTFDLLFENETGNVEIAVSDEVVS